jgi:D-alanine-D-alanine ligase
MCGILMPMIRVGVIRGGTGGEYEQSLASGAYVLRNLSRERYEPVDIFVDAEGVWHMHGKPVSYDKLRQRIDVAWNALDGFYGADGKVQQALESLGIPYTGSGPLSSAIAMHKKFLKDHLALGGVRSPRGAYIESWGDSERAETVEGIVSGIAREFSPPWIVEPILRSHEILPVRAKTREELALALGDFFDQSIPVLIEEAVLGIPASVMTIAGFRGEPLYTFLPNGITHGRNSDSERLQETARAAHRALSLGQYSRIEAIVTPKGHVHVTRVDTVPSFAPDSELHAALEGVGATFSELSDHLLFSTLGKR